MKEQQQETLMRSTNSEHEWTDDRIRELRQLWSEGHSTAEIGRRMNITKNAVVGKAHRLELPARPSPIRTGSATRPPRAPRRQPVPKLADTMPLASLRGGNVCTTVERLAPHSHIGTTYDGRIAARRLAPVLLADWGARDAGIPVLR